jgi:hypothetical protein
MRSSRMLALATIYTLLLEACVSLAPGADKVRFTKNPSDVSACAVVGNVNVSGAVQGPSELVDGPKEVRNQAIGLGGNVVFVTQATLGVPAQGVIYRCP